jgi:gliding motility-associated-like protein
MNVFKALKATLILSLSCCMSFSHAEAQIVVETEVETIEDYVNSYILGNGIQATNVTFSGDLNQFGTYSATNSGLPFDQGFVMATGDVNNIVGPNDAGGSTLGGGNFGASDADLFELSNDPINDAAILEFDFVAAGDTVMFNYFFGSDEYNEYVCGSVNDAFGFFLSGPGINGPFENNAVNLAVIPDTDGIPVTIATVNNGQVGNNGTLANCEAVDDDWDQNSAYYIDNTGNSDPNGTQLDGHTVTLVAWHEVQCGETYHIKLAIGDGGDTAFDSAVCIESGSFQSNAVVQIDLSIDVGGPEANTIYENCGLATLTFERPVETIIDLQEMVYINYGNSVAINGVDYGQPQPDGSLLPLPDSVVFAPYVSIVEFQLSADVDGVAEGPELVEMQIENVAACNGGGLTTYFTFYVAENPPPFEVNGFATTICEGEEVTVGPIVEGGYGNYTFSWDCSEGDDDATVTISPSTDWNCVVTVADTCDLADDPVDVLVEVEVLSFPPLTIDIDQAGPIVLDCNDSENINAIASGGDGVYSYDWEDEDGGNLFPDWWDPSLLILNTWANAQEVFVTVTDGCGFEATDSIEVSYNIPPIAITVDDVVTVLCNDPFQVPASATGQAPFFYTWFNGGQWLDWDATLNWQTSQDATITLQVQDNCGQTEEATVEIEVSAPDVEVSLPQSLTGPCTEVFDLTANVTSGSGGYQYTWYENGINMNESGASVDVQLASTSTISVNVNDGCGQSGSASAVVTIDNPPLVIELGPDLYASCVDFTDIPVDIISGAGNYSYDWFVSGESYDQGDEITLQSYGTVPVSVNVTDGCGGADNDSLVYHIPDIPLSVEVTPSTTICAGDGISLEAEAMGGEEGFVYFWPTLNAYGPVQYITPLQNAVYPVVATDICGEEIDASTNIEVQYLFSDFTASMSETDENMYTFRATPSPEEPFPGAYSYDWDFGDGSTSDEPLTTHVFDGLSDYTVTLDVTSWVGCTNQAYTVVRGPVLLYVPTAFTPNNDGINDAFKVIGSQIMHYELWIMNRWGETVFHSTSLDDVWVGDVNGGAHYAENGIYNWVIRLKGYNTDAEEYSGTLQLMR